MSEFKLHSTAITYHVNIHMAGDINHARQILRKLVMEGVCVQLIECEYIYTGGLEKGFIVRFIQYPRFYKLETEILSQVRKYAQILAEELGQVSYTIEDLAETYHYRMKGE